MAKKPKEIVRTFTGKTVSTYYDNFKEIDNECADVIKQGYVVKDVKISPVSGTEKVAFVFIFELDKDAGNVN
jgi:hypothetical protein